MRPSGPVGMPRDESAFGCTGGYTDAARSAAVIQPSSTIASSTLPQRSWASSGLTSGS